MAAPSFEINNINVKPVCSIFFHNYYGDHTYWINFFKQKISIPCILYYNVVSDSIYNLQNPANNIFALADTSSNSYLQKIIWRKSANKGKDIGGKLVLLDSYQRLGIETEYGLFLHDKKSIYKANNSTWANDLLKIAEPDFQQKAMQLFTKNTDAGIVTAAGNLINEYSELLQSFTSTNKALLQQLQGQYRISPNSFQYVAGTMFWFKMQPLNTFFTNYAPLKIRAMLEGGNITDQLTGSYTHCWERLLSWIINTQDHKIYVA